MLFGKCILNGFISIVAVWLIGFILTSILFMLQINISFKTAPISILIDDSTSSINFSTVFLIVLFIIGFLISLIVNNIKLKK